MVIFFFFFFLSFFSDSANAIKMLTLISLCNSVSVLEDLLFISKTQCGPKFLFGQNGQSQIQKQSQSHFIRIHVNTSKELAMNQSEICNRSEVSNLLVRFWSHVNIL